MKTKHGELRVVLVDPPQSSNDDLPALPGETALPANIVSNWKVNGSTGNSTVGTITPHQMKARQPIKLLLISRKEERCR